MQIFRGQIGQWRNYPASPDRPTAAGNDWPSARPSAIREVALDRFARLLAMEKNSADTLLADSPRQLIGIGNKTDEEIEIAFPGSDRDAAQKMRERRRRLFTAGAEHQKPDRPGLFALSVGTFPGTRCALVA